MLHDMARRFALLGLMVCVGSCAGPDAPDVAVCRDLVRRVCVAPRCAEVVAALGVDEGCEAVTLSRTGCDSEAFVFGSFTRERALECRLPLIRSGNDDASAPSCAEIEEAFTRCPELPAFLGAKP